jgi:energy-coupling factor transporter ATP-binding protein EcfA2
MYLTSLRLRNVGPFDDVSIPFLDEEGHPRTTTVILGDSGAGKTTILSAIACTRPGLCTTPPRAREGVAPAETFAVARWRLGDDDPARPHDLVVASPNAQLDEHPTEAAARKREQAHFDRVAAERGYCVIPLSAARWAGRVAVAGASPERPISAMDHRSHAVMDDASRADLAREVKQALVNAVTIAALSAFQARAKIDPNASLVPPPPIPLRGGTAPFEVFRSTFQALLPDGEASYEGVDPNTFEPLFRDQAGRTVPFDELAFGVKNRILMGGVILRRIALAYPGRDPLQCEAVALIDEVEAHLPQRRQREIVDVLRRAFPKLQLIVTTQSPLVIEGRAHDEVVVLSRDFETGRIEIAAGPSAVLH